MTEHKKNLIFKKLIRINFIKSALVNFRHFGMKGLLKLPIIIEYGSHFKCSAKDGIVFLQPLQRNMLTINFGNTFDISKTGKLIIKGSKACFNYKNMVLIHSGGTMEIGNNFYANGLAEFNCKKKLSFGDDVLISVHVMFLDTDYHHIYNSKNEKINPDKDVVIGNKVWIGCNVTILKGSIINDNIIVGAGSLVSGSLTNSGSIYSGNPIVQIRDGITWSP